MVADARAERDRLREALEPLVALSNLFLEDDFAYAAWKSAQEALNQTSQPYCEWSDAGGGQYTSACDKLFTPTNDLKGTLINFPFCPGCGRRAALNQTTNEK